MQSSTPDVVPQRDKNPANNRQQPGASTSATSDPASFCFGWNEAKRYTVHEVIGKGSYGVVCSARDNVTGQMVAIKKIQNVFDNVADALRILREIKLLRLLKHPDVVDVKHILLPSDPRTFKDLYVVFELMESDLHTVIAANDDLTADHHKVFLYQLLRGLNFMHSSGVLHRDLKPKNILANANCKLKLCDFGLARPYTNQQPTSPVLWTDYVATRWYRAPELCGCFYGRYTQAVDIWSIGCIFAEVLLRAPLFPGRDAVSQLQIITDLLGKPSQNVVNHVSNQRARTFLSEMPNKPAQPFEEKFPGVDPQCLDLLCKLLSFDATERPTAAEALAHPYFSGLPSAVQQEPVNVAEHFGFEANKLSETDVRQLIYLEVLHYHPHAQAAFRNQAAVMASLQAQARYSASAQAQANMLQAALRGAALGSAAASSYNLAASALGDEHVKLQFMLTEKYGGNAAAAAAAVQTLGSLPVSMQQALTAAAAASGASYGNAAHPSAWAPMPPVPARPAQHSAHMQQQQQHSAAAATNACGSYASAVAAAPPPGFQRPPSLQVPIVPDAAFMAQATELYQQQLLAAAAQHGLLSGTDAPNPYCSLAAEGGLAYGPGAGIAALGMGMHQVASHQAICATGC